MQARVVAATHRDLRTEAQAGRFREDLYYRLAVVEIHVPPLRERREDIAPLVTHFVERYAREFGRPVRGVAHDALQLLAGHEWRGNVRELSNAIERAVIFASGEQITAADLPDPVQAATPRAPLTTDSPDLREAVAEFERQHILRVIEQCDGNKRKAARLLGLGVTSLYRKLGAPLADADADPI
jgi:DNA-binding NtrC family response regulator